MSDNTCGCAKVDDSRDDYDINPVTCTCSQPVDTPYAICTTCKSGSHTW